MFLVHAVLLGHGWATYAERPRTGRLLEPSPLTLLDSPPLVFSAAPIHKRLSPACSHTVVTLVFAAGHALTGALDS